MENHDAGASFEAYSYRTSSRFGGRVRITINQGLATVSGARIGLPLYRSWLAAQIALLALAVASLAVAVWLWDWVFLIVGAGLVVVHLAIRGIGTAVLWEAESLLEFTRGGNHSSSFPLGSVKRVKVGKGWARRGLWLTLLPFMRQLNRVSRGHVVSFEAPDGDIPKNAVYAVYMKTEADASAMAHILQGGELD